MVFHEFALSAKLASEGTATLTQFSVKVSMHGKNRVVFELLTRC